MIAIVDAMADDLDTPRVVTLLKEYLQRASKERSEERNPGDLSRFLDALLGVTL
jgi:cysteinyl-tRNA synthetase